MLKGTTKLYNDYFFKIQNIFLFGDELLNLINAAIRNPRIINPHDLKINHSLHNTFFFLKSRI